MKVSKKTLRRVRDAIVDATIGLYDERCPRHNDGPPEIWDDETRKVFDALTEQEMRITKAVDAALGYDGTEPNPNEA